MTVLALTSIAEKQPKTDLETTHGSSLVCLILTSPGPYLGGLFYAHPEDPTAGVSTLGCHHMICV